MAARGEAAGELGLEGRVEAVVWVGIWGAAMGAGVREGWDIQRIALPVMAT